jgi:hypothetical protein
MAVEITVQDVTDAEDLLEEYLADKIEDGDYSTGSALRDLTIKAIAYNFAFLRATADQVRVRQSLKTISEVDTTDDEEAADDAVDEILSNWFASRNQGDYVRVTAYGHASRATDITIAADTAFYKTDALLFVLNNDNQDLFIPAEDLVPVFDSSGEITDYTFPIPLIADLPGTDYEVEAGVFASFDSFNAYVTRIETLEKASGGQDIETSDEYIERAQNLITVRNLINARSVDAVLRDEFEGIKGITTVGMGDPEMVRDVVKEDATGLELHVGAHMDMFLFSNTVETYFTGVVGDPYERPDGLIVVFKDPYYTTNVALFTAAVEPGMVLRITSGLPIAAHDYIIREVRDTELVVSERVPFPTATEDTGEYVTWSIGHNMPDYNDVIATQVSASEDPPGTGEGTTSTRTQTEGRVTLPGGPIYLVKDVTIEDAGDPDADADDGLVHFNVRTNTTPTEQVAPDNEYQVLVNTPLQHQSAVSFTELIVGTDTDPDKYDGKMIKVTYDTLSGFNDVHSYVSSRRQRVADASALVRGYHPAYLSFTMEYRLLSSATEAVDEDDLVNFLVGYINNFNPREVMSVNQLMDAVRAAFDDIGRIYPFTIYYDLHAPDGRVIEFESTEEVTVPWTTTELTAVQVYPGDAINGLDAPADFGVSDDVIRYFTTFDAIQVSQRV